MPRPSKKVSQAKTQQLVGNSSFTKIVEADSDESSVEWDTEDDDDSDDTPRRMRNLYSLSLPDHLQSDRHHQVWQNIPTAEALVLSLSCGPKSRRPCEHLSIKGTPTGPPRGNGKGSMSKQKKLKKCPLSHCILLSVSPYFHVICAYLLIRNYQNSRDLHPQIDISSQNQKCQLTVILTFLV